MSMGTETLYGIGQGNGAGPAFWLSNLIVMFFVLDSLCKGMNFVSPNGKKHHKSTGLGYVDDTNAIARNLANEIYPKAFRMITLY